MMNFENWTDVAHQLDAQIRIANLTDDGVAAAKFCVALADLSTYVKDRTSRTDIERLKCFWMQETPEKIDSIADIQKKYLKIKKDTENLDVTGGPDHWLAVLICGATTILGSLAPEDVDVFCEAAEVLNLDKQAVVRAVQDLHPS